MTNEELLENNKSIIENIERYFIFNLGRKFVENSTLVLNPTNTEDIYLNGEITGNSLNKRITIKFRYDKLEDKIKRWFIWKTYKN